MNLRALTLKYLGWCPGVEAAVRFIPNRDISARMKALVLLILGLVIGACHGYGIFRIPQPKLMFDLMTLLTFIYICIWTIRKRRTRERYSQGRSRG